MLTAYSQTFKTNIKKILSEAANKAAEEAFATIFDPIEPKGANDKDKVKNARKTVAENFAKKFSKTFSDNASDKLADEIINCIKNATIMGNIPGTTLASPVGPVTGTLPVSGTMLTLN